MENSKTTSGDFSTALVGNKLNCDIEQWSDAHVRLKIHVTCLMNGNVPDVGVRPGYIIVLYAEMYYLSYSIFDEHSYTK